MTRDFRAKATPKDGKPLLGKGHRAASIPDALHRYADARGQAIAPPRETAAYILLFHDAAATLAAASGLVFNAHLIPGREILPVTRVRVKTTPELLPESTY